MNELKVLVCDDIPDRGHNDTVAEINRAREGLAKANFSIRIEELFANKLSEALETLFEHVARHLPSGDTERSGSVDPLDHSRFDCDIVIIDNNLAALDIKGARLTAEAVAGYVRAFTNARYVVSLNKNPEIDFDLRYLVGDYQTQADVALNARHLSNPALWTGDPGDAEDGFLPWYWPVLGTVSTRRLEQIEFIYTHLRFPIVKTLDFPRKAIDYLSRHAVGALTPEANAEDDDVYDSDVQDPTPLNTVTFMDFFLHACRSLPVYADRERLVHEASDGDDSSRKVVAKVVAAEIDKWLRRDVVGPQDVLVDVPHLIARMPFLLGDNASDLKRWHDSLAIEEPPFGMDPRIYDEHVSDAKFTPDHMVKSPCFWWPKLKESQALNDLFFGSNGNWPDVVFCEDASRFRSVTLTGGGAELMQFAAEFEGSWGRRYVSLFPDRVYGPKSRFTR